MKVYSVQESDFYTEEYDTTKIKKLFLSYDAAVKYVKDKYNIVIEKLGDFELYIEDDEDIGEVFVGVIEMEVEE